MRRRWQCVIAKPENGEVRIDLTPCREVFRARKEVREYLQKLSTQGRIAGFDCAHIKGGIIRIYYNKITNPTGSAAETAAKSVIKQIESYED